MSSRRHLPHVAGKQRAGAGVLFGWALLLTISLLAVLGLRVTVHEIRYPEGGYQNPFTPPLRARLPLAGLGNPGDLVQFFMLGSPIAGAIRLVRRGRSSIRAWPAVEWVHAP
jgi:hypothetical protein